MPNDKLSDAETAEKAVPQVSSDTHANRSPADGPEEGLNDARSAPDFGKIVSTAQEKSAERLEQLRKRAEAIAREQRRRWDEGVVMLNDEVRPLLERALQACVEEGIPAVLEDNFSEKAATPQLLFYCSAPPKEDEETPVIRQSIKMVVEADGKSVRVGTAKSFSTLPEGMQVCANVEETVTTIFYDVLESYFQSCERGQACKLGA